MDDTAYNEFTGSDDAAQNGEKTMFYGYTTINDNIQFAAFETAQEAADWVEGEVGNPDRVWADNGAIKTDGGCHDFDADVYPDFASAVAASAHFDTVAAVMVLRALCDAAEKAGDE